MDWFDPLTKLTQNLKLKSPQPYPNKPWILVEDKVLIKPKQALGW